MRGIHEILDKSKQEDDNYLSSLHHVLMIKYGWIPFEEFKKLPIPTVVNLIDRINQDCERERAEYNKRKKK